jgi:hypothetical protein
MKQVHGRQGGSPDRVGLENFEVMVHQQRREVFVRVAGILD